MISPDRFEQAVQRLRTSAEFEVLIAYYKQERDALYEQLAWSPNDRMNIVGQGKLQQLLTMLQAWESQK